MSFQSQTQQAHQELRQMLQDVPEFKYIVPSSVLDKLSAPSLYANDFWGKFDLLLKQQLHLSPIAVMSLLLHAINNATDTDINGQASKWYSRSSEEQCSHIHKTLEIGATYQKMLDEIPSDDPNENIFGHQCHGGLVDILNFKQQQHTAYITRGIAKNRPSLGQQHMRALILARGSLVQRLHKLRNSSGIQHSSHQPKKKMPLIQSSRNKLVHELVRQFLLLKMQVPALLIIALCHTLELPETDVTYVKAVKKKEKESIKQELKSMLDFL